MNALESLIIKLQKDHKESVELFQKLDAQAKTSDYEDLEDATTRSYEEGFSDALEIVLRELVSLTLVRGQ